MSDGCDISSRTQVKRSRASARSASVGMVCDAIENEFDCVRYPNVDGVAILTASSSCCIVSSDSSWCAVLIVSQTKSNSIRCPQPRPSCCRVLSKTYDARTLSLTQLRCSQGHVIVLKFTLLCQFGLLITQLSSLRSTSDAVPHSVLQHASTQDGCNADKSRLVWVARSG